MRLLAAIVFAILVFVILVLYDVNGKLKADVWDVTVQKRRIEAEKNFCEKPPKIEPAPQGSLSLIATWYGESASECLGCRVDRLMANGQRFDETKYTAASKNYPLGTRLILWYGDKSVIVEVTDRPGRDVIDLSKAAFEELAPLTQGKIEVGVQRENL